MSAAPFALTSTRASRKLAALRFIKRYWAEHGASPSYGEIAAALNVSVTRVHKLVRQLTSEGRIVRLAGAHRGIALPERVEQLSEGDALMLLRELGWKVDEDVLCPPVTNRRLQPLPPLDHIPAIDAGDRASGKNGG